MATSSMLCPACGEPLVPWREARPSDARLAASASYLLLRCPNCKSAALASDGPGDAPEALYGQGTYRAGATRLDPLIESTRRLIDRDRMRFTRGIEPGGRVFEIGAGDGRFLAALQRAGYHAAGIEPAGAYAAQARSRGLDVEQQGAEELSRAPASQDAVILWHVLEHLHDPAALVRRIRDWLAPGGKLIVA